MEAALFVLVVLGAYLVGSLSFAVIVTRAFGLSDPRTYGSKNPGATNVLRSGHKGAAAATLLLDGFKGWLPIWLVKTFALGLGGGSLLVAAVGLAAFLGHLYPVFFGFKGGKGVATAAGVLLGFEGWLGLATVLTWLIVVFFTRYSSLAAVAAAVFAPAYYLMGADVAWGMSPAVAGAVVVMGALLVWRHRENIDRLFKGQESRLGKSK